MQRPRLLWRQLFLFAGQDLTSQGCCTEEVLQQASNPEHKQGLGLSIDWSTQCDI